MPRRAAKVDDNHALVVSALRAAGGASITVVSLAAVGKGVPDLLVGLDGVTVLVEVKDGRKAPSRRRLTPDQVAWFDAWQGLPVIVLHSPEQAAKWVARRRRSSRSTSDVIA